MNSSSFRTIVLLSSFVCLDLQANAPFKRSANTPTALELTEDGLMELKQVRDELRSAKASMQEKLIQMDSITHAGFVARIFKAHMFLYGLPGGAKSLFVDEMLKLEKNKAFQIQLHQMVTEQAMIGGQNFTAAKEGEYQINTRGSIADFETALVDEVDKGNPSALAVLLGLLNERKVRVGNKVYPALLETMYATSNANLPEFLQSFIDGGQHSTAPALLNRFLIKVLVTNWLPKADQRLLDKKREQTRLREIAYLIEGEENSQEEQAIESVQLNWTKLRHFAFGMFRLSQTAKESSLDFEEDLRQRINKAAKLSMQTQLENPGEEPFAYFPSADFTERLRQNIPEVVIISSFVSFLLSPLADDASIENFRSGVELGPDSLWRVYLIATTVGSGSVSLKRDENDASAYKIHYSNILDNAVKNKRDELMIRHFLSEQQRFADSYSQMIQTVKITRSLIRSNFPSLMGLLGIQDELSFEQKLIAAQKKESSQ